MIEEGNNEPTTFQFVFLTSNQCILLMNIFALILYNANRAWSPNVHVVDDLGNWSTSEEWAASFIRNNKDFIDFKKLKLSYY